MQIVSGHVNNLLLRGRMQIPGNGQLAYAPELIAADRNAALGTVPQDARKCSRLYIYICVC